MNSGTEVPEYGKGRMRGNPSRHAGLLLDNGKCLAAPAAAHQQGGQAQQPQGSSGRFRNRKHNAVVKFDVVDIYGSVQGRVFPKEAPNWEPVRAGEDGFRR